MSTILITDDDEVLIVDTTVEGNVSITGRNGRDEGTPELALVYAERIRNKHGDTAEEFTIAIEEAARYAIARRERKARATPARVN